MISYIRGELAGLERDKAIVDVQGVGYGIYMPEQSLSLLGPIGCEVKIHTYLTGMEYTDAMDSDPNAQQIYKITDRQALALFAKAAAKQTDKVDMRDIIERMGMTDAVIAVQLATLFFSASTRAGRLRISKK